MNVKCKIFFLQISILEENLNRVKKKKKLNYKSV